MSDGNKTDDNSPRPISTGKKGRQESFLHEKTKLKQMLRKKNSVEDFFGCVFYSNIVTHFDVKTNIWSNLQELLEKQPICPMSCKIFPRSEHD